MPRHRTRAELESGLPDILASPADDGELCAIVVRPCHGERISLESCAISAAGGAEGDHWAKGCWKSTDDGRPDPDVQICIMNARCISHIAGEREHWAPAGDNLFVDLDLSPENLPAGQALAVGSAVIEVTAVRHFACSFFIERFGRDAAVFVNTGQGRKNRLRGIYARVLQDGQVRVGDRVRKIPR
jgi:MOSC domain-containing protein YiiM